MRNNLKIFIFCFTLSHGKGGAERIATDLIFEMANRGHDVYVGFDGSKELSYEQHPQITLVPLRQKQDYIKRVLSIDPDVFFVFYFNRDLMEYRRYCPVNIPFGMQECTNPYRLCYNNWENKSKRIGLPLWERELVSSGAARIRMVMTGYEKSFPPYIRQNVRAFPNSAPETKVFQKPGNSETNKKRIIIVGGLKANKNLPLLFKAFSKVTIESSQWEIHDYGTKIDETNKYHQTIQKLANYYQLTGIVIIHGPTDDMFSEYAKADIHVIPSLSEGCPTCVLEAMALGLPSIGIADCPGTNKLIEHNINGLLVDNDKNGDSLGRALHRLMSSPSLRKELGRQAYFDSKIYQPKRTYDNWENIFKDMAKYKNNLEMLFQEQVAVDKERAMHMARCRRKHFTQES